MHNNILFLTLRVFSATGGIEKVCRLAGMAMCEIVKENKGSQVNILSMYDNSSEIIEKYFPTEKFKGFGTNKLAFINAAVKEGRKSGVVILSHINLLLVGFLIKLLSPKTKIILVAHGIEVWSPISFTKKIMLQGCNKIITVSNYTREKMIRQFNLPAEKFIVLNNCIDPFLPLPLNKPKNEILLNQLGIDKNDFVLLTLTRLSFKERYKGYDNVLVSIKQLKQKYPRIKYLITGKYEPEEKDRLDKIIESLSLYNTVIFTGFIPDEEIAEYFNLADCYIMPSKKEGFGIVFIEAMYYRLPVIAGGIDGSTDALLNGKLGLLVNPDDQGELTTAMEKMINNRDKFLPDHNLLMDHFSYPVYKKKLKTIIESI